MHGARVEGRTPTTARLRLLEKEFFFARCSSRAAGMVGQAQLQLELVQSHVRKCAPSVVYVNRKTPVVLEQYILQGQGGRWSSLTPLAREACVLRALRRFVWAPRLLCVGEDFILTTFVGRRACLEHAPADHKSQIAAILNDLSAAGVRHNDLHKVNDTDFVVGSDGRMSLLDYGWAALDGSLAMICEACGRALVANGKRPSNPEISRGFREPETVDAIALPRCSPEELATVRSTQHASGAARPVATDAAPHHRNSLRGKFVQPYSTIGECERRLLANDAALRSMGAWQPALPRSHGDARVQIDPPRPPLTQTRVRGPKRVRLLRGYRPAGRARAGDRDLQRRDGG